MNLKITQFGARIARHELGHWLMTKGFGFSAGAFSVEFPAHLQWHSGKSEIGLPVTLDSKSETEDYIVKRIQILYAGAIAEALNGKKVDELAAQKYLQQGGAASDWPKIKELVHLLRNMKHQTPIDEVEIKKQLDNIDHSNGELALKFVERNSSVINAVAAKVVGLLQADSSNVGPVMYRVELTSDEMNAIPEIKAHFDSQSSQGGEE